MHTAWPGCCSAAAASQRGGRRAVQEGLAEHLGFTLSLVAGVTVGYCFGMCASPSAGKALAGSLPAVHLFVGLFCSHLTSLPGYALSPCAYACK